MTQIVLNPGVMSDIPWTTKFGTMKAGRGLNIRWRFGQLETLGLFGPLRNLAGEVLQVPTSGSQPARALFTAAFGDGIQILVGALNRIDLVDVDPASVPGGLTRYRTIQLGSTLTPTATDVLPSPSLKQIRIPAVWWFAEQENTIIGMRAGVDEPLRAWDRDRLSSFDPIPTYEPGDPLGSPTGLAPAKAVAGGIINRIAVLLGAEPPFSAGPGDELMSIRWSARGNFQLWDPTIVIDPVTGQANVAGSLQLERGSRIMGGGATAFGIVVWTDKAMAMLTETGDLASVFARNYISNAGGMLANRAWCEADGQVWWIDNSRELNVYDGGRPRTIANPMRKGTIDRVNEIGVARIFMTANPEFHEIIIAYPSGDSTECDRQMVYNYLEDSWSIWGLSRGHWFPRQGIQESVAIALDNTIYAQDIGPGCPNAYRPDALLPLGPGTLCGAGTGPGADTLTPIVAFAEFGPMTFENGASETFDGVRILMSWLPTPSIGAESDVVSVTVMGFDNGSVRDRRFEETQEWTQGDSVKDYRVSGRALSIRMEFDDIKTVYRLGLVDLKVGSSSGGER